MFEHISTEIIVVIVASITTLVTSIGAIYIKKISNKIKQNMLKGEVSRYVEWAKEIPSFEEMERADKVQSVVEQMVYFCQDNEIVISDKAIELIVEKALYEKDAFVAQMGINIKRYSIAKKGD